jgi:small-conductance mechanosensitive channel
MPSALLRLWLVAGFVLAGATFAQEVAESNASLIKKTQEAIHARSEQTSTESKISKHTDRVLQQEIVAQETNASDEMHRTARQQSQIAQLATQLQELERSLNRDTVWSKVYSNYSTYRYLIDEKRKLETQITELESLDKPDETRRTKLAELRESYKTITGKLDLLKEYEKDPFSDLIKPESTGEIPEINNPFSIITAISFEKHLRSQQDEYQARFVSLKQSIEEYRQAEKLIDKLLEIEPDRSLYLEKKRKLSDRLKTYLSAYEIFETTLEVYTKKVDEVKLKLEMDMKQEIEKVMIILIVLLLFFLLFLLAKYLLRRYLTDDDERSYTINKILNFIFLSLLLIVLLFSYIENVSYFVTVLGFASAGIAIAMKDWFMSLLGWLVIVIGGAVHVGDRVKFVRNGVEYVGDIVDISMLRLTMHEDVTLTTYYTNRRAGRMIFIPNNYIFTDMIANYSHAGLKTVWDGIDFVITFDSDIQKAISIAKEISRKYSKGYTDITRKQLNKLRRNYSIRNTNVEPRILSLIEPYGVKISIWYLTNSYATLTLRSTISQEIIERIQADQDVSLAFPTQSLYLDKDVRKPAPQTHPQEAPESHT